MESTAANPIPRIGSVAPDFKAITTHGELRFSEWQGDKWVVLFSHPADFTPVCSTELVEFARRNSEFEGRNVRQLVNGRPLSLESALSIALLAASPARVRTRSRPGLRTPARRPGRTRAAAR